MKQFLLFLSLSLVFAVASCNSEPYYVRKTNQLITSFAKEVASTDHMHLSMNGGALYKDIKSIDMGFQSNRYVDVEQARLIYISLSQRFIAKMNSDLEIRPYLHNFPSTYKNVFLSICFMNSKNDFIGEPYIARVKEINGTVFYSTYDGQRLQSTYKEPYEEALRIYQEHCQSQCHNH